MKLNIGPYIDPNKEYLYRYFDNVLEWESKTKYNINLESYEIIKETPCGYWIKISDSYWPKTVIPKDCQKFVLKNNTKNSGYPPKRYAYATKEDAYTSFKIRKNRQKGHQEHALKRCNIILKMIENNETEKEFSKYETLNFITGENHDAISTKNKNSRS